MESIVTPPNQSAYEVVSRRVCSEFKEMPGLALTPEQAAKLLGLASAESMTVLEDLRRSGVLRRRPDGRYLLNR